MPQASLNKPPTTRGKMKLALAVLALLAVVGPVAQAQSSKKCLTIQQVIDRTPSLSLLKGLASQVPGLTKVIADPKAKLTFLAPSDKVLKELSTKAVQLGLLDPVKAVNILLSHVLRGNYDSQSAWVKANGKKIQRLALGPANVSIQIADDFKNRISYYIIVINSVTPGYKSIRITFASNKKSPAIKTCAGTVYIVDSVFIPDV